MPRRFFVILIWSVFLTSTSVFADTSSQIPDKCLVLLSNDDGIGSPNLLAYAAHIAPHVELVIAAPAENQSGMSSALGNWRGVLAVKSIPDTGATHAFSIAASPVIAARFGLWKTEALYGRLPDLVVSGPNSGLNWGNAARYSGTIGAAREGAGRGIPGLAISVARRKASGMSQAALDLARDMTLAICEEEGEPLLLNFNLPPEPKGGVSAVEIATPEMNVVQMDFQMDEDGNSVRVGLGYGAPETDNTDVALLREGKAVISILPMENQATEVQMTRLQKILTKKSSFFPK